MRPNIRLGRLFGIEIGLHYSWFLIALMIVLSLSGQFQQDHSDWAQSVIWAVSILTALFFFAALLTHELSHALVARSRGLKTNAITLFALGGVAQIEKEPEDAKTEFWVGIIGPIASFVIGLASLGVAWAAGWRGGPNSEIPLAAMFVWLGYINLMLAAFNMIPGFPLDGGRILRAIVWWITGDGSRSTKIAARTGQVVALLFILLGIFRYFNGEGFGGLWISFIGWFLLQAAGASYAGAALDSNLKNVRVADLMTRDCPPVDGNTNLEQFVSRHMQPTGRMCFVVEENGQMTGLVTANEISEVERNRWPFTLLSDIMRPMEELHSVAPETTVIEALETMGRDEVNQLPVFSGQRLAGIITRANVLQFLQTRTQPAR